MAAIIIATLLLILGYLIASAKIITQSYEALVERLGKYHRKLKPGLNFIVPFLDIIVIEETKREQVLDIPPQEAITRDNVSLSVDAVVYWQIFNLERAYYAIDNVEKAIETLVLTTLRSEIGRMELEETYSSRKKINQLLLHQLDEATEGWGIKVTRVEVRDIKPPPKVLESLEQQKAAEIRKRAAALDAEGTVEYLKLLAKALESQPNGREVLQFLLAQKYVDANFRLGDSPSSKVVFMDPKAMSEAIAELMHSQHKGENGEEVQ